MKRTDDEGHPHDQQGAKRDRPYQEPGSNVLPGLPSMVVVARALGYHPLIHGALLAEIAQRTRHCCRRSGRNTRSEHISLELLLMLAVSYQ